MSRLPKQFAYDFETKRIGKAIERSHEHSVVVPKMSPTRKTGLKYALAGVGLTLAVLICTKFVGRKPKQQEKADDRAVRL